jgi:hypothetical protein
MSSVKSSIVENAMLEAKIEQEAERLAKDSRKKKYKTLITSFSTLKKFDKFIFAGVSSLRGVYYKFSPVWARNAKNNDWVAMSPTEEVAPINVSA